MTFNKSVWKNYFDYALNLSIRADRVENFFREHEIFL